MQFSRNNRIHIHNWLHAGQYLMVLKKAHIAGVGEVVLAHSPRARRITLSIRPFKGIRVAVPRGVSFDTALAVAQSKAQWLKKHLDRMAHKEQEALENCPVVQALPSMAKKLLVQRTHELAALHGFAIHKVFVRRQRTRWGSCSYQNNINLNIQLAHLPTLLIDYIILHELVHTRVRNHGQGFWDELGKYVQTPKQVDRELDRYWILLADLASE